MAGDRLPAGAPPPLSSDAPPLSSFPPLPLSYASVAGTLRARRRVPRRSVPPSDVTLSPPSVGAPPPGAGVQPPRAAQPPLGADAPPPGAPGAGGLPPTLAQPPPTAGGLARGLLFLCPTACRRPPLPWGTSSSALRPAVVLLCPGIAPLLLAPSCAHGAPLLHCRPWRRPLGLPTPQLPSELPWSRPSVHAQGVPLPLHPLRLPLHPLLQGLLARSP
jgi:hypothetical protein